MLNWGGHKADESRCGGALRGRFEVKIPNSRLSAKHLAYGLNLLSLGLLAAQGFIENHFTAQKVLGAAVMLMVVTLLLCLTTPSTARNRWMPFLIAFILFMIHGSFVDHLGTEFKKGL